MKVLDVQPYVPGYRRPLFDELARRLEERGDSLTVASGQAKGGQAQRGDTASGSWHVDLPSWSMRTPVGELKYRHGLGQLLREADCCVMELDPGNLNAWQALATRRRPKLVLWGHGKSYVSSSRVMAEKLKLFQAGRADHVMTYSSSGRSHLVQSGLRAAKVSAVGNSTDTATLRRLLAKRLGRPLDVSEAYAGLDVAGRNVAMYVGGLDLSKRIPFLLAAARRAFELDPRFLLLVAGSGEEEAAVRAVAREGIIAWIPAASPADLVDMAAISSAVWMPGRVGLVAVDALALGKAIFTTPFPFHAPEYDFLTPGRDVLVLGDEPGVFAQQALEAMANHLPRVLDSTWVPSIELVARNMLKAIDTCMSDNCSSIEGTRPR